jgi:hypothetical protein
MSDKWLKTMNTTWIKPQENYHNLIEYNAAFLFRISFGQSVQVLQYIKKVTKLLPFSIQRIISGLHIICKCFIYMINYCNFVYTLLICFEMVWKLLKFDIKILLCYMLHMMSHSVGFPYMKLMNVITNSDVTN